MVRKSNRFIRLLSACMGCALIASLPAVSATVEIKKVGDGWQLLKDGQPFTPKGASGGTSRLDVLVAHGGNAVRTFSPSKSLLDQAQAAGVMVMLGISGDNLESARQSVLAYKDHPALLMWGLGNEMESRTSDVQALWRTVESIAAMIKEVDGKHPSMTVLAEIGGTKLADLKRLAPSMDAVGINSYGSAGSLATRVPQQGWEKAFFVTEFGPKGHWEVGKTAWGLPMEPTSSEKADTYLASYKSLMAVPGKCLGTFAFLWGQKQEKTHTWYGMFLPDGSPLGTVEAMGEAWTGKAPADKGPRIGTGKIRLGGPGGGGDGTQRRFQPGVTLEAQLDVADPEGGTAPDVTWDLRIDVSDNPAQGGAPEPNSSPLPDAVILTVGKMARIKMPTEAKNYRIFAYAKDAKGRAATANAPIQVAADAPALGVLHRAPGIGPRPTLEMRQGPSGAWEMGLRLPQAGYAKVRAVTPLGEVVAELEGNRDAGYHRISNGGLRRGKVPLMVQWSGHEGIGKR